MPHYKDGTEAKIEDQVCVQLYNNPPGIREGALIFTTPGVGSCNAMVAFLVTANILDEDRTVRP